jgi:glycosyltransferase involved in cell wall biosynthesis
MNVLFFAKSFYPNIGGVEKHLLEVSNRLIKKGFKITVITEDINVAKSKGYKSEALKDTFVSEFNDIKIIRIGVGKEGRLKKFRIWLGLVKHINTILNADIVHCHDIFFWYLPFRFIFPFKKVYTTFHGYEGNNIPGRKEIFMHKIAEKLSFGNICVGDYLQKWYGTKPTIVTYGAISIPKNLPQNNRFESIRNALYIGRLEEEAGILIYLKVLKILKSKNLNINLTVLGDGSQGKKAKDYAKKNQLKVDFKGFVKDVYKYLPNSDVVFSGRYLGTMEAFVFRKFVFAVYNNEIKRDCFALAPYRNFIILEKFPNKLAQEVFNLSKKPEIIKEKTNKAFNWVSKQTWDKLAKQYISLWS